MVNSSDSYSNRTHALMQQRQSMLRLFPLRTCNRPPWHSHSIQWCLRTTCALSRVAASSICGNFSPCRCHEVADLDLDSLGLFPGQGPGYFSSGVMHSNAPSHTVLRATGGPSKGPPSKCLKIWLICVGSPPSRSVCCLIGALPDTTDWASARMPVIQMLHDQSLAKDQLPSTLPAGVMDRISAQRGVAQLSAAQQSTLQKVLQQVLCGLSLPEEQLASAGVAEEMSYLLINMLWDLEQQLAEEEGGCAGVPRRSGQTGTVPADSTTKGVVHVKSLPGKLTLQGQSAPEGTRTSTD
ncbi:hypothetical protein WJX73_000927 [Symbiochloris irregularis]|uniref:Uncharacterized protein n=1 Tax=Symbiochloris irregularis TaxID=706552 RepID=A0AAW1PU41_9CHLO